MTQKDYSSTQRNHQKPVDAFDPVHYGFGEESRPDRSTPDPKSIPQQVGEIYGMAPNEIRIKMLEYLLRPIGVLPLVAVARGVFAKIRFRSGWPELKINIEDIAEVQVDDVISLAEYVLQENEHAIFGLEKLLRGVQSVENSEAVSVFLANLAMHFCSGDRRRSDDLNHVIH